jgi:hypothetical protein
MDAFGGTHMTVDWQASPGSHGLPANDALPAQPRAMVVQTELIPNLPLVASIARVGFKISGPFNRAARAFKCVDEQPDVAVLDVSLRDGMSFGLARALRRRKTPCLFCASPDRAELIPPEFRDLPLLEKPTHFVLVARLLSRMIREGQVLEDHLAECLELAETP